MRPGVNISIVSTPPSRAVPTDTGVWFASGLAEKGPTDKAQVITSLSEYVRYFGQRVSYGMLYDAMDVFFREGGSKAYLTRLVGPAAVTAFVDLGTGGVAKVSASSPGAWGNSLNVAIVAGPTTGYIVVVTHDTIAGELERSPEFLDVASAVEWSASSDWIRITDLAPAGNPIVQGPLNLATGADDQAGIVDATWTASLLRFTRDLGPGQVSFPGRTTSVAHLALTAHAFGYNRTAILDAPDTNTKATILASLVAARVNGRWGAMYGPWVKAPGFISGTTRIVPPSPYVAGKIAKRDAQAGSPNAPAAGDNGEGDYVYDLSVAQLSDTDREEVNTAGFNAIIKKYNKIRIYGWRSVADPAADPQWVNFGSSRMVMLVATLADQIGETFLFDEIDGQGRTINAWGSALTGMLMPYWDLGSLYGATAAEAFVVDVGPTVNTPTTIQNRELRAAIAIKPSPFAEMIVIEIMKALVTDNIS
jgi:hypothetical protein